MNNEEAGLLERFRKRDREKLRMKQKNHLPVMDLATLTQICIDNDGYETPELNDNLYVYERTKITLACVSLHGLIMQSIGLPISKDFKRLKASSHISI